MLQALIDSGRETSTGSWQPRSPADATSATPPRPRTTVPVTSGRASDPLVGRTIGHYEILARLGGGGMGVVYKAQDRRLDRTVALKFLPPQWSQDWTSKQRFVREARAASAAEHRNICTIYELEETPDGQLFIVMAYYAGQTLKQKLDDGAGPLGVRAALDIAAQVADGLARAHANGIVHRDIKPGNLMLTDDGVRILDFGIAKFADALQLTASGSTFGTIAYMSPEQLRGDEVDGRTDIWAVGVVLYQMLTGELPFRGANAELLSRAIWREPPRQIRARRDTIPADVMKLVLMMLRKDPGDRPQSAAELADSLRRADSLIASTEGHAETRRPAALRSDTHRWLRVWNLRHQVGSWFPGGSLARDASNTGAA